MPIPVIANAYQAQVVFESIEGADVNTIQNTFFFEDVAGTPRTHAEVADLLETKLETFYNVANPGASNAIRVYMSRAVNWTTVLLKVYDLGQAAPRIPELRTMELTQPASAQMLPNEVAVVLSYRSGPGTTGGGTSNPRKRGRLYLGPWQIGAATGTVGTDGDARVDAGLITSMVAAAEFLANEVDDLSWEQYSRVDNAMARVDGGFVNNRFDTQRRRGQEATTRTVWTP